MLKKSYRKKRRYIKLITPISLIPSQLFSLFKTYYEKYFGVLEFKKHSYKLFKKSNYFVLRVELEDLERSIMIITLLRKHELPIYIEKISGTIKSLTKK